MEPTSGLGLGELQRLVHRQAEETRTVRRWDHIRWYRKAVVELCIITASVISIGLYLVAVVAFARWVF